MRHVVWFLVVCLGVMSAARAEFPKPANPLWAPMVDSVYLQEVGTSLKTEQALSAVAVYQGTVYVGDAQGVKILRGETLEAQDAAVGAVDQLVVLGDSLWARSDNGLWRLAQEGWQRVSETPVAGVCLHENRVVAVAGNALYAVEEGGLKPLATADGPALQGLASYGGTIYVHDGKRVGLYDDGALTFEAIADWGTLPRGCTIRDMMAYGSKLYVATDEGLALLRGMTWYTITGEDGLCYEDTTCLAQGFDRDLWVGTKRGAIRNVAEAYQFFGHERWIPHDKVNAIACGDNVTYIATGGGLGIITYEPYTLAKKAAYYERWLAEWGMKRLGFIHSLVKVNGEWVREVSDNDVGYSSHYLIAKCFEYAVTGDPNARAAAVDAMKSVKWSEEITPLDGFPARSVYAVGEKCLKAQHGSGGLPAEWHPTEDGVWEWKGDTSSDETDAHVYETTVFLELVANDEERVWATDHLRRLVGHIVDNGYVLRDVDGLPTRWARWDPEYLQRPYGYYARGLNGLEILNYVTTARHFTGEARFDAAKQQLLDWNYHREVVREKLTYPIEDFTHFDDRLAFYEYFPIIQYETDPALKSLWLRSLERSWEIKRIEAVPWFNFIYGALTGNDCELDRAVDHLRGWPLDLHRYSFTNSHRDDLHTPKGYRMYAERPHPLNPRETEPDRWDGDFMRLDNSLAGTVIADPGGWLDAYWMGRYYGMITPPQTKDKALTTVPDRGLHVGAAPYEGPARPKLWHER